MVIKKWTKGQSAQEFKDSLLVNFPSGEFPTELRVIDTSEVYQYEDANMIAQQKAGLISRLNISGWTDVTP